MIREILLWGIYLKEMKTWCWRNICNPSFSQLFRSWYAPNLRGPRGACCAGSFGAHGPSGHTAEVSLPSRVPRWDPQHHLMTGRRGPGRATSFSEHARSGSLCKTSVGGGCGQGSPGHRWPEWPFPAPGSAHRHPPLTAALGASCCQKSWRRFGTGPATSAFQRCGHSSSWSRTWLWALWGDRAGTEDGGVWKGQGPGGGDWDPGRERGGAPGGKPGGRYLVRTSSLHLLMMQESSKRMGNQPRTQTLSPGATFMSSLVYSCSTYNETVPQRQTQQVKGRSRNRTTRRWKPLISPPKNLSSARVCWGILQR